MTGAVIALGLLTAGLAALAWPPREQEQAPVRTRSR